MVDRKWTFSAHTAQARDAGTVNLSVLLVFGQWRDLHNTMARAQNGPEASALAEPQITLHLQLQNNDPAVSAKSICSKWQISPTHLEFYSPLLATQIQVGLLTFADQFEGGWRAVSNIALAFGFTYLNGTFSGIFNEQMTLLL